MSPVTATVFDPRPCELGEGPLWHPQRAQLYWFDILGRRLLTRRGEEAQEWRFAEMVSAAGWLDRDRLLIAAETRLFTFNLETGAQTDVVALEADDPQTRSNDGRADPQGGFWIGTMGKAPRPGKGAIYRLHRNELRCLFPGIAIPNAIAFAPDGRTASFADSPTRTVWRVALDAEGWPEGAPQVFLTLPPDGPEPDGAVFDAAGRFWLAEWGAGHVACYAPDGTRVLTVPVAAPQASCPALSPDGRLFVTSARQGMHAAARATHPASGQTFRAAVAAEGQAEHRVRL
jgi:sugar lactone lactonase YvrE